MPLEKISRKITQSYFLDFGWGAFAGARPDFTAAESPVQSTYS